MPLQPRHLLRAIFDRLPDPVVVSDARRSIVGVNAAFTAQFGYGADEMPGRNARLLYADPGDFDMLGRERFNATSPADGGKSFVRYRRKDGSTFQAETIASQITADDGAVLGFVGIIHDLTAGIALDEQKRRLEHILSDTLDAMPEGYVLYDDDDRLILCNESYRRLYDRCAPAMRPGVTFEGVLRFGLANGQFPEAGHTPESHERFIRDRLAYHNAPDGAVVRRIGPDRWIKVEDVPTRHGYRLGIRTDVSDLKRAQDELHSANLELERKNDALRQFTGIVSHDLQAPLRHIAIYAGLLAQEDASDDERRTATERITAGVARMQRMVSCLLEYSKVAYRNVVMEPVSSAALLEDAVRLMEEEIGASRARLAIAPLPAVRGDGELLSLLFRNLIANALKYRADAAPRIDISAEPDGAMTLFSIADNGIGIDGQHAEHIFEPFRRLHLNQDSYEGAGIGLTLCQRIVESHGGRIWLDTGYGGGARFCFTLPAVETGAAREPAVAAG